MENPPNKPSVFKRFFRKTLFVLAALITLAALLLAEENWRGAHAWQSYKRAREAKGDRFDSARLIPPAAPDDQNFAATPYFAANLEASPEMPRKITGNEADLVESKDRNTSVLAKFQLPSPTDPPKRPAWQYGLAADMTRWAAAFQGANPAPRAGNMGDPAQAAAFVLDQLKPLESALAEIQTASQRPFVRFNFPYEEFNDPRVISVLPAHLADLKRIYRILSLRAQAELVLGQSDKALNDVRVLFRVDDGVKDEPLIISQMVRWAGVAILLQPVCEGLAEQRWSDAQLGVLQERLRKTDILASTVLAFQGERDICCNPSFDRGYMFPPGWNRLEQLSENQNFDEALFPRIDLAAREINPGLNRSIDLAFYKSHPTNYYISALLHHRVLATMMAPALSRVPEKAAHAQNEEDLAMLACALERCRLATGQYPETLDALVPRFVAVLPHDIINGQPLKYRRSDKGRFILYSVGWNEKDDGGIIATIPATKSRPARQDTLQGAWVLQYPE